MRILSVLTLLMIATTMSAASQLVFIGTYTPDNGSSRGIYALRLDTKTGALSQPFVAVETANPTFITLHPRGRVLYALGETKSGSQDFGKALSYSIDRAAGTLKELDSVSSEAAKCAHVAVDGAGQILILTSYHGGSITAFPLDQSGRIGKKTTTISYAGPGGPNAQRQEKPHPHSVTFSPDNRFAYVCDLGQDKIFCYAIEPAGELTTAGEFSAAPGAGPRHSKFSADGKFFYVINELASTIATYACNPATGALEPRETITTLPADFKGDNLCAEIRLHPNGRFVYGSNRGHDSLVVFSRNAEDGRLTLVQTIPCGGGHPRNFALSPDGAWLLCANRDSNNVVSFKVDATTGRLTNSGYVAKVPQAVCVLFVPPAV